MNKGTKERERETDKPRNRPFIIENKVVVGGGRRGMGTTGDGVKEGGCPGDLVM